MTVVVQDDWIRVIDELVLRGNSALLKCLLPSYAADFVTVDAWLDDRGGIVLADGDIGKSCQIIAAFLQMFPVLAFVPRPHPLTGRRPSNTPPVLLDRKFLHLKITQPIIIKRMIIFFMYLVSFVIRAVQVVWQEYETRVNDEFVLRGNAALLKCLLPSYVSDVIHVEAWIGNQGQVYQSDGDDQSGKITNNPNYFGGVDGKAFVQPTISLIVPTSTSKRHRSQSTCFFVCVYVAILSILMA